MDSVVTTTEVLHALASVIRENLPRPRCIHYRNALSPKDQSNCLEIQNAGMAQLDTAMTITLPDGRTFTGMGATPLEIKVGEYTGLLSSVTLENVLTPMGEFNRSIHFFDDGEGNTFWTNSLIVGYPIAPQQFQLHQKLIVVGGTGVFENARGVMRINGVLSFPMFTVDYEMGGAMCL